LAPGGGVCESERAGDDADGDAGRVLHGGLLLAIRV
jgi:hypothetical protein